MVSSQIRPRSTRVWTTLTRRGITNPPALLSSRRTDVLGTERPPLPGQPGTHFCTYPRITLISPATASKEHLFLCPGMQWLAWSIQSGELWTSVPREFPWGAQEQSGLALLPVGASSYGIWVRRSSGLARPGSKTDHKPGCCFQAWNLLLCNMGRGFPCRTPVFLFIK